MIIELMYKNLIQYCKIDLKGPNIRVQYQKFDFEFYIKTNYCNIVKFYRSHEEKVINIKKKIINIY